MSLLTFVVTFFILWRVVPVVQIIINELGIKRVGLAVLRTLFLVCVPVGCSLATLLNIWVAFGVVTVTPTAHIILHSGSCVLAGYITRKVWQSGFTQVINCWLIKGGRSLEFTLAQAKYVLLCNRRVGALLEKATKHHDAAFKYDDLQNKLLPVSEMKNKKRAFITLRRLFRICVFTQTLRAALYRELLVLLFPHY